VRGLFWGEEGLLKGGQRKEWQLNLWGFPKVRESGWDSAGGKQERKRKRGVSLKI